MYKDMENVFDLIMNDQLHEASQVLLTETVEEKILKNVSETSYLNMLLKFEEYLNDHDVYLFGKEWDNAELDLSKVKVDKFWVTIYMIVSKETDLRGAKRILNDKEEQNKVQFKKLDDGRVMLKFRILKRYLDNIERKNKERAEEIADREIQS